MRSALGQGRYRTESRQGPPCSQERSRLELSSAVELVLNPVMAFTIRQLQFFVAAAEAGTVSRAAQALSISQSSVTEAIKELEADLDVKLFERHPRGLSITHKGHQLLRHATRILTDISDARRSFSEQASNRGGRLQLGVTSLVAGYVLSDILARYRRAFPSVEIHAIEDNGDYLEHLLIGGELDVAVMVVSNLRDRLAIDAEIVEVSPYRLWLRCRPECGWNSVWRVLRVT